jgi:hypothetical protein
LIYFLRSLDCLSSFAARENEDFISVTKVVGCSLAVAKETFIAYIQVNGLICFGLIDYFLLFVTIE